MSLEWKSYIVGGITSGIVGGVVGGATVYTLSWALDSIFGLEVGKPGRVDQKNQMIDALKQIDQEITTMNAELAQISNQLDSLQKEMSSDFQRTIAAIEIEPVITAVSSIEGAWQALYAQVRATANGQSTPDGTANAMSSQILNINNGIRVQINIINNNLMPMTASPGLLDTWTNALILQILQGESLRTSYLWLEQSFLQYLQYLEHAHSLMVAAQIQQSWIATDSVDQNEATAQQVGNDYMAQFANPNLRDLSQMFLQCVYRLILCTYNVPTPSNNPTGFMPFTSQADADYVLGRANLVNWQVNLNYGDPSNPGIMVTSFLRPSQLINGAAPVLTASSSCPPSSGQIFVLKYGYANKWYKVVDYVGALICNPSINDPQTQLRDFNDSNIVIANYSFPTTTPPVGHPVQSSGFFSHITPKYYDTNTLDPVSQPTDNTVYYGYGTDLSGVTTQWLMNYPFGFFKSDAYSHTEKNNDVSLSYSFDDPIYSSSAGNVSNVRLSTTIAMTDSYNSYDGPSVVVAQGNSALSYVLQYQGRSTVQLVALLGGQTQCAMSVSKVSHMLRPLPLGTSMSLNPILRGMPNDDNIRDPVHTIFSYNTDNVALDGTLSTNSYSVYKSFSINPHDMWTMSFELHCSANGLGSGDYNDHSTAHGYLDVSSIRLAWPQPVVS